MNIIITILLIILVIFILWQIFIRILRRFFDFPAPAFIGHFLDSDFRRKMQPSDKIIARSRIKKGMRILEVGCGSGAFTTFVARVVGEEGEVFALDIQLEMLKQIEKKLKQPENQDIKNIGLIEGDALDLPFENNSFDLIYTITVFQELPDKNKALKEMKRVLKPQGILSTLENSLKKSSIFWGIKNLWFLKAMNFRCSQNFQFCGSEKSKIFHMFANRRFATAKNFVFCMSRKSLIFEDN